MLKREWTVPGIDGARIREVSDLPTSLVGAVRVGPYSVAKPGVLLRVIPGLARFLVQQGTVIDVVVEDGADRATLDAFLHGAVLGALIHQRGELPLHASTLVPPSGGGAVAIAGPSGVGKSTLAYELIRRGWTMLSDDLTRVTCDDSRVSAWPGRSMIKLWADACANFGLPVASLAHVPDERDKYLVPVPTSRSTAALSIILHLSRECPGGVSEVDGVKALALLAEDTYRLTYVAALGQTAQHLRLISAVVSDARLLRLGPAASIGDLADTAESSVD